MSKLLSLKIADRLQPIVLSFSKGAGTVRGASIDLRELAGSTGSEFTECLAARRWNSQTSGCEYSRRKEARNTLAHSTGDQTPEASQVAYPYADTTCPYRGGGVCSNHSLGRHRAVRHHLQEARQCKQLSHGPSSQLRC